MPYNDHIIPRFNELNLEYKSIFKPSKLLIPLFDKFEDDNF